jgi:hypothetical protein
MSNPIITHLIYIFFGIPVILASIIIYVKAMRLLLNEFRELIITK